MASKEHLDILKQGVEVWNQWRKENLDIRPDLSSIDLSINSPNLYGTLTDVSFRGALLMDTNLQGTTLTRVDLSFTNLLGAALSGADLTGANLTFSHLMAANFVNANLNAANLNKSSIVGTYFRNTNLEGADFSQAMMILAVFADVDLSMATGLDTIVHDGPSTIGIDTIYKSKGNIPEAFLKGAGVDDTFITYMRSLTGKPIEHYSCFISYSSKDEAFAKRLYSDLQSNNVRCWFAPEDLKWGERIRSGIDEAIRLHDKLLLILSKHSVASGWVEREVKTALAREKKEKRVVLFPVRVDNAVFNCPYAWATDIQHERNIGDFTRWKNHDDYQQAFDRLLRDLKART